MSFKIGDKVQINKKNIDSNLNVQLKYANIRKKSVGHIEDIVNDNGPEVFYLVNFTINEVVIGFKLYESEIKLFDDSNKKSMKVKVSTGVEKVLLTFDNGTTQEIDVSKKIIDIISESAILTS